MDVGYDEIMKCIPTDIAHYVIALHSEHLLKIFICWSGKGK